MSLLRAAAACATFSLVILASASAALAQTAARAYVSTKGSDAGACGIGAPCKTFNYALSQVAPGAEIIALTTGVYDPVVVGKSASLIAAEGVHAIVKAPDGVNAVQVTAPADSTVVLRRLNIVGTRGRNGVHRSNSQPVALHIEDCTISGFAVAEPYPSGFGVYIESPGRLFMSNTVSRGNHFGLYLWSNAVYSQGSAVASITGSRFERNAETGAAFAAWDAVVRDSVAAGNATGHGFSVFGAGNVFIEDSVASGNANGLFAIGGGMRVSNSTVVNNTLNGIGLAGPNSQILSRGNNTVEANAGNEHFNASYGAK